MLSLEAVYQLDEEHGICNADSTLECLSMYDSYTIRHQTTTSEEAPSLFSIS